MQSENPSINPYLAIMVAVAAISFSSLFVKLCSAPPEITAFYRLFITFALISPVALSKYREELFSLSIRDFFLASLAGVFLSLHFVVWFYSLKYTSVASSVVLVTTQPLFVVAGSYFIYKEKISRRAMLGALIAFCGSVWIGYGDFGTGSDPFLGDLMAIFAAVMVSGYLVIGRGLRRNVSLPAYTFIVYGSSSLIMLIASVSAAKPLAPYPLRDWLLFTGLAVVCTLFGHTIYNWVMKYVPASSVAVSVLGEPVGAMVWVALFLNEYPVANQIIGGAIILFGIYQFSTDKIKSAK